MLCLLWCSSVLHIGCDLGEIWTPSPTSSHLFLLLFGKERERGGEMHNIATEMKRQRIKVRDVTTIFVEYI